MNALVLGWLSYEEHHKTIQPSTVISVYFFFSLIFDTVQVRTQWLTADNAVVNKFLTVSVIFKAMILVLETKEKAAYLILLGNKRSPEEMSGILNRGVFYWLNRLIVQGAREVLLDEDLYALHHDISTASLMIKFWPAWKKVNPRRIKYHALIAIFNALKWDILSPVFPRLILIAFTMCQPLLLRTTRIICKSLMIWLQRMWGTVLWGHMGLSILDLHSLLSSTGIFIIKL